MQKGGRSACLYRLVNEAQAGFRVLCEPRFPKTTLIRKGQGSKCTLEVEAPLSDINTLLTLVFTFARIIWFECASKRDYDSPFASADG